MLLKQLLFEIFGKRFTLKFSSLDGKKTHEVVALVSKNTKEGEREYRVTWFDSNMHPYKHYDIDQSELDGLLTKGILPKRVGDKIISYMYRNREIPQFETDPVDQLKIEPIMG